MCETGTRNVLTYFSQLESELLQKSKEPPDTGFYHGRSLGVGSPQSTTIQEYPQLFIKMFHTITMPTSISTYLPILVFVGTDTSNPPPLNFLDHDQQLLIKTHTLSLE
jgi:hypothetical protein